MPAGQPDNGTNYSELPQEGRKRPGPKKDPNALIFRSVGLPPRDWAYVETWASENDYRETDKGRTWNPTPAIGRAVEELRRYRPVGQEGTRVRDARGRFAEQDERTGEVKPAPVRPSRTQLEARIRQLEAELSALREGGTRADRTP
jgi:hypothetical protein